MSDKKEKKQLSATAKKGIRIGVIFVVIIAILSSVLVYLNTNHNKAYSKLIIACMPHNITGNDNGKEIDFFVEYNKDYNPKSDAPLKAYQVYYKDDNGKKIILPDGHYKSRTADMQVLMGFFYKAQQKIDVYKNVVYVLITLLVLAGIAVLIYFWYKSWCKRQEKKKNFYLRDFHEQEKE